MDLGTHPSGADLLGDAVATVLGRRERPDPVSPRVGGPAGNARLTAWLGLALLVGLAVEGVTLLDLGGLLTWHVAVGALLVPIALAKTATTGWRVVRYYTGYRPYVTAGPPPLLLRVVGPLVVLTTLAVLGTGLAVVAEGDSSRQPIVAGVDMVLLHKASFIVWLAPMTVHVLARTVPAATLVVRRRLPGGRTRLAFLGVTAAVAALAAVLTVSGFHGRAEHHHRDRASDATGGLR